jgi:hypothetical protein
MHSSIESPIKLLEKTSEEMEDASFSSILHFSTLLRHYDSLERISGESLSAHSSLIDSGMHRMNSGIVSRTPSLTSGISFKKIEKIGSKSLIVISGPRIFAISKRL